MGIYRFNSRIVVPNDYPFGYIYAKRPPIVFTTGGHGNWFEQEITYHTTPPAWRSGSITHNQQTWLKTEIRGPGTLSFYWKVSSESGGDPLIFLLDSVEKYRISGSVDWVEKTIIIPTGIHELEWRYTKDVSINTGSDAGWVDDIMMSS